MHPSYPFPYSDNLCLWTKHTQKKKIEKKYKTVFVSVNRP